MSFCIICKCYGQIFPGAQKHERQSQNTILDKRLQEVLSKTGFSIECCTADF